MDDESYSFLEKITDQIGYQVIMIDGTVVKSSGDLSNRDLFASIVMKMLKVANGNKLASVGDPFKCLTITFDDYFYSISTTGSLIFVVKRRLRCPINQAVN